MAFLMSSRDRLDNLFIAVELWQEAHIELNVDSPRLARSTFFAADRMVLRIIRRVSRISFCAFFVASFSSAFA